MNWMAIVVEFRIRGTVHEGTCILVNNVDMRRSQSACRTVSEVDCHMGITWNITSLYFGGSMRDCTASEHLVSTCKRDVMGLGLSRHTECIPRHIHTVRPCPLRLFRRPASLLGYSADPGSNKSIERKLQTCWEEVEEIPQKLNNWRFLKDLVQGNANVIKLSGSDLIQHSCPYTALYIPKLRSAHAEANTLGRPF